MKNLDTELQQKVNHIYSLIKAAEKAGIKVIINCPNRMN